MKKTLAFGIVLVLLIQLGSYRIFGYGEGNSTEPFEFEYEHVNELTLSQIQNNKDTTYDDSPPSVQIISPKHGSIINESQFNVSIICTDDVGIVKFSLNYCGKYYAGGIGKGFSPKKYYQHNMTMFSKKGYHWMVACAYDEYGNFGYDYSVYYCDEPGNTTPMGTPPEVEILKPENNSIVYIKNASFSVECKDDDGIVTFSRGYGSKYGSGCGGGSMWHDPYHFYHNETIKSYPGHNWVFAMAYDENGSVGYDLNLYYYNTSKDIYPPTIDILFPNEGDFIFCEKLLCDIKMDIAVIIGNFWIVSLVNDIENHLSATQIYLNDDLIEFDPYYNDSSWYAIMWDCDRFLFGFYEIKIIASDSFGNTASEKINCFVIDLNQGGKKLNL